MKILYISPENTVGTLPLWKKIHESNGNTCDIITLYRTKYQDDIGICLDLPMVSTNKKYINFRHKYYKYYRGELGDYTEREGCPPTLSPNSFGVFILNLLLKSIIYTNMIFIISSGD